MDNSHLIGKDISYLQKLLIEKQVSCKEIISSHLDHIRVNDKKTNAFITVLDELALTQADKIDNLIAEGEPLPPLAGVPIALKDNINVEGYRTTCASKVLENFVSKFSATVTNKLFNQGAICVGKGSMDEFAMGSSSENTSFSVPRNPWNLEYVAGGSSGGPAVAVASGYSALGIGSDTGGSIRLPASFCGVVGMKPTYGLVSRFGLVAYASSLDQIGPFATCVKDAATTLSVIAGHDPKDSTSLLPENQKVYPQFKNEFVNSLREENIESLLAGKKVGIISDFMTDGTDKEVSEKIEAAATLLKGNGATVDEVNIPYINEALAVYYIIATAEASANLARFDGIRYGERIKNSDNLTSLYNLTRQSGFNDEVKRRIMLGTYALSSGYYDAYYKKAQQVRRLIKESFDNVFKSFDILLSPIAPSTAFKLGEKTLDPLQMYLTDIATLPVNLAGLPAISIPFGLSKSNLPIGIQLIGKQLSDEQLISTGYSLESLYRRENKVEKPQILEHSI